MRIKLHLSGNDTLSTSGDLAIRPNDFFTGATTVNLIASDAANGIGGRTIKQQFNVHVGVGAIHGTKFHDANLNESRDEGEQGIEGITMILNDNGNRLYDSGEDVAVTDVAGNYLFTGLTSLAPGVAVWPLNESGATVSDVSGNENNGTIVGATSMPGRIGNALSFDGSAFVEFPDSRSISPRTIEDVVTSDDVAMGFADWRRGRCTGRETLLEQPE